MRDFALGDVAVGDLVEVRGVENPDNAVLASELRRDDPNDQVLVQGAIDSVAEGASLTLLGVTVQPGPQTEYRDAQDNPLAAADFFAAIGEGTFVKANGTDLGGGVLAADEVELEQED